WLPMGLDQTLGRVAPWPIIHDLRVEQPELWGMEEWRKALAVAVRESGEAVHRPTPDGQLAGAVPIRVADGVLGTGTVMAGGSQPPEYDESRLLAILEHIAPSIERRLSEMALVESQARMEDLLEQAQAAARAKSEFLANMSHEIR